MDTEIDLEALKGSIERARQAVDALEAAIDKRTDMVSISATKAWTTSRQLTMAAAAVARDIERQAGGSGATATAFESAMIAVTDSAQALAHALRELRATGSAR